MDSNDFTEEEKRVISLYLQKEPKNKDAIFQYGIYILPSLLFAIYGLVKEDYIAVLVAWVAMFAYLLWYLNYVEKYASVFYSIIGKYESRVSALSDDKERP